MGYSRDLSQLILAVVFYLVYYVCRRISIIVSYCICSNGLCVPALTIYCICMWLITGDA